MARSVDFSAKLAPYFENTRTPNEPAMYKSMIRGIAANCMLTSSNTESTRKVNLTLLSLQVKFLNFRAKSSKRETKSSEKMIVIMESITELNKKSRNG